MVYAGLDVHKRCTQICIEDESGALLERRILTERHRLLEEFADKPRMRSCWSQRRRVSGWPVVWRASVTR